jgi:hypothetical protein
MSSIKHLLMVGLIALAVLGVAGCLGQSDRDKAQERYDHRVLEANDQISIAENVSRQQLQYAMTEPVMKAWLVDYRSQVVMLENNVTMAIDAGNEFLGYLNPGSSEYATVKANEQNLRLNLDLYKRDYNKNVESYNGHWGVDNGTVSLL